MTSIKQFFLLLRLSHWSKAAFVLLGVLYSRSLAFLPDALLAAFSFCLIASAVYIYNDIQDREEDRLHPHKRKRPLASEEVSLDFALIMLAVLLLGGVILALFISTNLAALLGLYLLINLAYNHFLKNLPVVDVLCIASGFMLRVLAGTIGIGLPISWWLTLTATLISLFIALCKRRLEKQLGLKYITRPVLKKYSFRGLDAMIITAAVSCFIVYLLYTIYAHEESYYFLLTLPFAAIGLWRFVWLTMRGSDNDDPVSLFVSDNLSRFNFLCFLILTFIALFK
ncbi:MULTISPECIES: decaprenyl-phosphate phosphoribosyltransferase [Legionella]|uniref:Phosphoribose diphosphate:decaprenyl-phosphate phosphoribosyltransferase n=1 Tax=Legionella maceachernii TaxID=466 RepID=A0A0W0WDW1_9GAMM|nr:decaprenyl-phosphate phosphoribosyltransferase [Legionella maceachernii]KTD30504.1 phosphoribose diphosphate:decaprenyl-phosphate phosphoribosyltransferase [Legionella maceachernii]SKA16815.1 4-hydroxybenzoate polyprenyltransferase [Legionella maceachernii]SUP01714.1 phosphoribose diphosphate:decaprenyl-phosphate phosphoribosyltransferase [Legionella maceachernii]